ncbi:MAG: hypothetical protein KKH98_02135 [Spirochaetes bacterium]|nr:hypothetical protein [Spirochaetota bacterium]
MNSCDKIKALIPQLEQEVEKLEGKKVKAAASRVRKHLMEISKLCKDGRKEAMDVKNRI